MKAPLIVLNAALFALLVSASCLVSGRASEFKCSQDSECTGFSEPRMCDLDIGYCVTVECPSDCNGGCDTIAKTCRVNCPGAGCTGGVDCPTGYACTITCGNGGACSSIDCSDAASCVINCGTNNACGDIDCGVGDTTCQITCNGTNACDDIDCSDGRCTVSCNGTNACASVDCADSCSCTATCGTNACGPVSCPAGCEAATGCMAAGVCTTCS